MRYTREDFANYTPPRLMGSESEINVPLISPPSGASTFLRAIEKVDHISRGRRSTSIVLPNGGEIYLDLGKVVESTTPECLNAREVLLHELVGERAVRQMADALMGEGRGTAYKRAGYAEITDENGGTIHEPESTGHHENYFYIAPENATKRKLAEEQMKSYLYTRASWAGTGIVTPSGYAISQKIGAVNFTTGTSEQTHGSKKPLKSQHLRMEVRTGEGHMSEWAIVQKFALTSLVLRLIEHNKFPEHLMIKKFEKGDEQAPLYTPFCEVNTRGEAMKSTEHQRAIARAALDYFQNMDGIPKEELAAATAVIKTCDEIDDIGSMHGDVASIHDRVEWASKLSYLRRTHNDEALTTKNHHAVMLDLKWDNIGANGIGKRWYKRYGQATDASVIDSIATTPPQSRAAARVADLKHLVQDGKIIRTVEWHEVTHTAGKQYYKDPYGDKYGLHSKS